jgi:hypothetical protein
VKVVVPHFLVLEMTVMETTPMIVTMTVMMTMTMTVVAHPPRGDVAIFRYFAGFVL